MTRKPQPADPRSRLRLLLSAYACEPGHGSEPGIGWHVACQQAEAYDVWVLTRANNRPRIERELARRPRPGLRFIYFDLPLPFRLAKRLPLGVQFYYPLWQRMSLRVLRRRAAEVDFDVAQHITFGRYWTPSPLPALGLPFVWGPLGGGDAVPAAFRSSLGASGRLLNVVRDMARRLGELSPLVGRDAREACAILATTPATARRIQRLGSGPVSCVPAVGLSDDDLARLGAMPRPPEHPVRFISIGRLAHWKGFHYGLRAYAKADLPETEFWIVGDGPERGRLKRLVNDLGIANRVRFFGFLSREETLARLGECHVLVHPSLHDSGGWVCLEAMAARRPVIYLDLGGPPVLVSSEAGIAVDAATPDAAVGALADGMSRLASSPELRGEQGLAGRRHVEDSHSWTARGRTLRAVVAGCAGRPEADQ